MRETEPEFAPITFIVVFVPTVPVTVLVPVPPSIVFEPPCIILNVSSPSLPYILLPSPEILKISFPAPPSKVDEEA